MSALEKYPRITPFLWFESKADEAVAFYVSVFRNSRILETMRSSVDTPSGPKGTVLTISFELDGVPFTALNGGAQVKFNDAISLFIRCDTQQEIDYYWAKLTEGGGEVACGWLKDKFGVSWQVAPTRIFELISNEKGMKAMMQMKKLDIAELERAEKE
jgi:predicted 3-demethylubiquinone-9 3-methyltransferase (glyoxalase superfamily)